MSLALLLRRPATIHEGIGPTFDFRAQDIARQPNFGIPAIAVYAGGIVERSTEIPARSEPYFRPYPSLEPHTPAAI